MKLIIAIILSISMNNVHAFFGFFEGEEAQEKKPAENQENKGPKYVKVEDVKIHLDCDNSRENEEKSKLFEQKYKGARLVFSERVQAKNTNTEYILDGWLGEDITISKFNCLPHIVLSGDSKIQPQVDIAYKFDCRVSNFCEEGAVMDGQIGFDDCKVLEQIK